MIEIVNRQRGCKIKPRSWREFSEKALALIGRGSREATIVFVGNRAIKELNKRFRGRDYATDVLSFRTEAAEFESENAARLGDVVISVPLAVVQAKSHGLSLDTEIKRLILHGLLHLCGYDHETDRGEMRALEFQLRRRLKI